MVVESDYHLQLSARVDSKCHTKYDKNEPRAVQLDRRTRTLVQATARIPYTRQPAAESSAAR